MSAVIWFGIVAVWAFVLIPTWVRRGEVHWRRSGETGAARQRLGRAARVVNRQRTVRNRTAPTRSSPTRSSATSSPATRTVAATSGSSQHPARTLVRTTAADSTAASTLAQSPPDTSAEPEVTMASHMSAPTRRPAPRREPLSPRPAARHAQPPHVQRARRLVWIAAVALATLMLALISGGIWVLVNLVADVALLGYLRHLRRIALQQQAARRDRARGRDATTGAPRRVRTAPARTAATRPATAPRPATRPVPARRVATAAAPAPVATPAATRATTPAPTPAPAPAAAQAPAAASARPGGPVHRVTEPVEPVAPVAMSAPMTMPSGDPIDLTDDAPTQEILTARAV